MDSVRSVVSNRGFQAGAATTTVAALTIFLYARSRTPKGSTVRYKSRQDLPSLREIALVLFLGRKVPPPPASSSSSSGDVFFSIVIDNFSVSDAEMREFHSLAAASSPTSAPGRIDTKLLDAALAPHVFLQHAMLTCLTHERFPVSLIGAVHLRSVFLVHDPLATAALLMAPTGGAASSPVVGEASYIGLLPVVSADSKTKALKVKGVEVFVALRLRNKSTNAIIWEEVIALFSSRKASSAVIAAHAPSPGPAASVVEMCRAVDFTNLNESDSNAGGGTSAAAAAAAAAAGGGVTVSAADTFAYGLLSRDVNPIHMSTVGARLLGQRSRIAHGILALSKVIGALAQTPSSGTTKKLAPFTFAVSFKGPVPCGSKVAAVHGTASPTEAAAVGAFDVYVANAQRPSIVVRELPISPSPSKL